MIIPRTVEMIDGSAFARCESISIRIEDGSEYFVVEGEFLSDFSCRMLIRYLGNAGSVCAPNHVDILGPFCFSYCQSLSCISFESNSALKSIEPDAFRDFSLESIILPRTVEMIHGSAFSFCHGISIGFEEGNKYFIVEEDFMFDFDRRIMIRYLGKSVSVCIPNYVYVIGEFCFSGCNSVSSISFECDSILERIECHAFSWTRLTSVQLPATVEFIAVNAFPETCTISRNGSVNAI
jgi:hypothetical protein